jgi:hypothetical protein
MPLVITKNRPSAKKKNMLNADDLHAATRQRSTTTGSFQRNHTRSAVNAATSRTLIGPSDPLTTAQARTFDPRPKLAPVFIDSGEMSGMVHWNTSE